MQEKLSYHHALIPVQLTRRRGANAAASGHKNQELQRADGCLTKDNAHERTNS